MHPSAPSPDSPSSHTVLGKRGAPDEPIRQRVKRHKGINAMTDAEAEKYSNDEILSAFKQTTRSPAYDHYIYRLERHFDVWGSFLKLVIRFECKHNNPTHSPICRDRLRSSDGTTRLLVTAHACDQQRGVVQPSASKSGGAETGYSEARHRAILALRCARNHRPFESVADDLHRQEVELLRPGTTLPTPATVSTDAKRIYGDIVKDAGLYLQKAPGALHLALDGWSAPTSESYLGVIVFWRENNKIWRTVLEFIHLTEAHTGSYLGDRIYECLERFGITEKIMSTCMDNALNNDTLVRRLKHLVPSFDGSQARLRCLAHIINLMAKAFMSLFSPSPPKRATKSTAQGAESSSSNSELEANVNGEVDADKMEHDDTVVKGITAEAMDLMRAQGVSVSDGELASARKIMFKVAGLARRVNDSAELINLFRELVDRDLVLHGDARALTRRVATRWNTDRASLNSHIHFRDPVQLLTSHPKHNLKKYALDDCQWELATELSSVLEIFQEPTDRFSQAEIPLIHEVIPELLTLKSRLEDIRANTPRHQIHPITRVAAQAALLVFDKYIGAMQESDIYMISVVMCPDRKLQWFADRGYDTKAIRAQATCRFEASYASKAQTSPSESSRKANSNVWTQRHSSVATATSYRASEDSIEAYFNSPCVPSDVVAQHGGVLGYWNSELARRPAVAQMALDFLTAPATSVDAERAFSGGRLMINHLQHQMSPQTFQAQMAIGAWYKTPLLPDALCAARSLEKHM